MIFVVDDSAVFRKRLMDMLREIDGIEFSGEAGSVAEAIERIQNLKPKVVILDIQMPDGNGLEVLKTIKQQGALPVVIMLTNHSYQQYRNKSLQLGADYFLDKTKEFEKLVDIFKELSERFKY